MTLRNQISFARSLVLTNLKASTALRGAFLLQSIFMILNNAIFFSVWWIFFSNFHEVRGWRFADITALYAIVSASYGIAVVLGGGVRQLAKMIADGELDTYMTQPKNLLLQAVASRSSASGWGDIVTGICLIAVCGYATPARLPLVGIVFISSSILFLASAIIIHSLAFWMGAMDSLARQMVEFVITFSIYPQTIFSGALKLMLFTVIPAGFIGYLPVELLRDFHWTYLLAILGGVLIYGTLAVAVFYRGLRVYESGNRFGALG